MKYSLKTLAAAILAAAIMTLIAGSGLLRSENHMISDALYQQSSAPDGEIIIIGIDQNTLEQLGPLPWPRSYMADVVSYLNSDSENLPAVIGLDVLYIGHGEDEEVDTYLAEAAAMGDNVVVAGAATFGSELITDDTRFYMDEMAVLAWEAPYDELAAVAEVSHINAMADTDGIIRHNLLSIDTPDGIVYSFGRVIYEAYANAMELPLTPLPKTDDNGFFYLPYTAEPGGYDQGISFADVYFGNIDLSYFKDKIVLIGPYAPALQDEYRTSIDHAAPMYGVEIQANQIDAYRTGFFPNEVGNTVQMIFLFLSCTILLLVMHDRKMGISLMIWLGCCIGWGLLCIIAYRFGFILHVLYFPLMSTVIFIASVAINYIRTSKEKRHITATFGRYVAPAVLKELLVQGGNAERLGGEMHEIAVLFVDIRGFTTMSEALDPPTVVAIINKYLTLTTDCIMRYQGTLDKFVGDCTMAFWNAPLPQEDYVYLACRAAMDMVEGSKALGEELMQTYGRTVSFGIGVHVGPAVVGNIGAPRRMDYTAIGDTVNTSARLEANAPGGKILISRAVADILGERAKTTSLGSTIKLKGKAEGFEILTLDELTV